MDTSKDRGTPHMNNPGVDYERSDLSIRGIVIFLAGVAIAGIIIHLLVAGMFVAGKKMSAKWMDEEPNPMVSSQKLPPAPPLQNAGPQSVVSFPEPRLQTDDTADMNKLLLQQEQELNPVHPYRTADGAVHISIDEAMSLVVQRGLPVRQQASATQAAAASAQTAPNREVLQAR